MCEFNKYQPAQYEDDDLATDLMRPIRWKPAPTP